MTTVKELVRRGAVWPFTRCSIKRVLTNGNYETTWQDISPYVVSYPVIKKSFGDTVYLGDYIIDAGTIIFNNSTRFFNPENENRSFFYGYLTRYRTKIKIEYGFYDDDGEEVQGLVFYGIFFSEPSNSDDGRISFSLAPLIKVFQNYAAYGVSTSGSPSSADMIDRIVKQTRNEIRIFDRFMEGANDSERYKINPNSETLLLSSISAPSIAQDDTCWKKISDYSFAEDFFPYIDNTGNFVWDKKSATDEIQWVFNGAGSNDGDYGVKIVSIDEERSGINNVWTRFVIEYNDQTFYTASDTWEPGDGSYQDIYGERTYSYTILDLDLAGATTIASALKEQYKAPKREWSITTVLLPQLELKDRVQINYVGQISTARPFIVSVSSLDESELGTYLNSINLIEVDAKIIELSHDFDARTSKFKLREV